MWDKLEIHCEGTKDVKKNVRSLLIQEYEYFEAKSNNTIKELYDRFIKLLIEMTIFGKVYDSEETNTKFIRALSEEWDNKTTTMRGVRDLDEISLEELYGRLKTYDMEMQQRKSKKVAKAKSVALIMESTKEQNSKVEEKKVEKSKIKNKRVEHSSLQI